MKSKTITANIEDPSSAFKPLMDFMNSHDDLELVVRGRPHPKPPRVRRTKTSVTYYTGPDKILPIEQLTIRLPKTKRHHRVFPARALAASKSS
jgi:hypothetical protein